MSAERIGQIRDFYDAVSTGDMARAESYFAPSGVVIREAESLPYGGAFRGAEGYRELMGKLMEVWKRVRFADFMFASGTDCVMARFTMSAISRATGRETSFGVVEVFEFEGDRIAAIAPFHWDTHAMRQTLGLG